MSKRNKVQKIQNEAKPIWETIHPTVRQVMIEAKVSGVHGKVSDFDGHRIEIHFTHDNNADVCSHKFWFDFDQVDVIPAF